MFEDFGEKTRSSSELGANRWLADAESPTLYPENEPGRRIHVRTHMLPFFFGYVRNKKAQSTAQQYRKNNENKNEKLKKKTSF